MIKVSRRNVDVWIEYFNDFGQRDGLATTYCGNIVTAKVLVKTVRKAIKEGYGFAKCRAILEGDTL